MKRLLFAVALAASAAPVLAADVGVSINIGQPGFYGRIDIGDFPQPQVVYRQPVVIERVVVTRPPVYLRVRPGHEKNWRKHCREYNACGEQVYFVRDNWYQQDYVPRYQERHGDRRDKHKDKDKHRGNDRHNDNRGNDRNR